MAEVLYHNEPELHVSPVMSERVQALANNIYREFEVMISTYGDGVIKNLMPQVVTVLENLNQAYRERQEQEVEAEVLREENATVRGQFDREKLLRQMTEKKYLETEETIEEERKQHSQRVEMLEANVRRLEMKIRVAHEKIVRQDERKKELKEEYTKLQARYTDMFKSHTEYVERLKIPIPSDRYLSSTSPKGISTVGNQSVSPSIPSDSITDSDSIDENDNSLHSAGVDVKLNPPMAELAISKESTEPKENHHKHQDDDSVYPSSAENESTISPQPQYDDLWEVKGSISSTSIACADCSYKRSRSNASSVFDKFTSTHCVDIFRDTDYGVDLSVMSAEVEKIIMDYNAILETKNALNVVKDDLIARLDEFSGEHELLREELNIVRFSRDSTQVQLTEREEELRKCYSELEELKNASDGDGHHRFSRVDMARIIMERNQFKEKLMDLQETVRYTELLRASREFPDIDDAAQNKTKFSFWRFFSNLTGGSKKESPAKQMTSSSTDSALSFSALSATSSDLEEG